jgi:methyltransferase (TIGR00027 family)
MVRPIGRRRAASEIRHVSDTALWAATFRAHEGRRADAAFDDPLASILAGDRGPAIARAMPRAPMVEWSMVIRTSAIDHLIDEALIAGVDTVVNLGAGLDTRPYRMNLPATLRWVELDFPSIVELKDSTLLGHQPVCRLERVGVDLLDRPARGSLLARYGADSKSTLFISEGVIPYFSAHDAAVLASELHATPGGQFWIQDFDNAGKRRLPRGWAAKLEAAPFLFEVEDWFAFFENHGWRPARVMTNLEQSRRIKRPYPLDFPFGLILRALPQATRDKILSLSGAVLMKRAAGA